MNIETSNPQSDSGPPANFFLSFGLFLADSIFNFGNFDRILSFPLVRTLVYTAIFLVFVTLAFSNSRFNAFSKWYRGKQKIITQKVAAYKGRLFFKNGQLSVTPKNTPPLVVDVSDRLLKAFFVFAPNSAYNFPDEAHVSFVFKKDRLRIIQVAISNKIAKPKGRDLLYTSQFFGTAEKNKETPVTAHTVRGLFDLQIKQIGVLWVFIDLIASFIAVVTTFLVNLLWLCLPLAVIMAMATPKKISALVADAFKMAFSVLCPMVLVFNIVPLISGMTFVDFLLFFTQRSQSGFFVFMAVSAFYLIIGYVIFTIKTRKAIREKTDPNG